MKTKIKSALSSIGIQIGDEISKKTRRYIRRELGGETQEGWDKFYKAWYAITNDRPGTGANPVIRTA